MPDSQPERAATRRTRTCWVRVAGLLAVIAAIAAALGGQLTASSSPTAASRPAVLRSEPRGATGGAEAPPPIRSEHAGPRRRTEGPPLVPSEHGGQLGEADGAVPDGTTVFDDEVPGVAKLDPALLSAVRRAAIDARDDGVELFVDSGWRSREYQKQLLREAILEYGSEAEATRWVAAPNRSAHVSGGAVDIGPSAAATWLSEHGAEYALCQIYANEPWHYELRPEAIDHGCPAMYADPTHDPRMQR